MPLDFRGRFGVIVAQDLDQKWQNHVFNDLRLIEWALSGRIMIRRVKARPKRLIRVDPWDPGEAKRWGVRNATSTGRFFADPVDKYRSKHIRAQIDFNSNTWHAKTGGCCHQPGATSDQVLFHEFVHAIRQIEEESERKKTRGGLAGYGNTEEFFAVVLTNIYMSDPTNPRGKQATLRADHSGFSPLAGAHRTSHGFFKSSKQAARLVGQFCRQHGDWARELLAVRGAFNPVAAYLRDPKRCEASSAASASA